MAFPATLRGAFPTPLERAGTVPSRAGPYFFEEIGERTPRGLKLRCFIGSDRTVPGLFDPDPAGKEFFPTPLSLTVVEAAWVFCRPTWPAASKTNASWPAHRLGRREKWVIDGRRKGNRTVTFCLFPKGTYPRPQPAQLVGGVTGLSLGEGRRPGIPSEVQPPPHTTPTEKGSWGGTSSLGFFSPFLPKKWGARLASQGSCQFQRRRRKTAMAPHPSGPRPRSFQRRRKKPRRETTFFFPTSLICVILWS